MAKNKGLGRRVPKTWEHVEKYPLTAAQLPVKPQPVTVGINWYDDFDNPVKKGYRYWIGLNSKSLGRIRGGHCVCMPHLASADNYSWYKYYDQGEEGACVGFGSSRMMSLLNREMYNAWWLWDRSKEVDGFPETNPGDNEGTTVSAAMDILRKMGHMTKRGKVPLLENGILVNRWATQVDQAFRVLQNEEYERLAAIPILNSWGKDDYPHIVWMPCDTWQRLMNEDGEFTMITDR